MSTHVQRRAGFKRVQRRAGFTMIELMIVVAIIGIMAATIGPSLSEILADNRQFGLAQEIVSLTRDQRDRTWGHGFAGMARFRESDSNNLGSISLYAGMNNKCMQTPWNNQVFVNGAPPSMRPFATLNTAYYNPTDGATQPDAADVGRHVIALRANIGGAPITEFWWCIQPNGETYAMTTVPANFGRQTQTINLVITRWVSVGGAKVPHGRDREIVFPIGGTPRLR